MRRFQFHTGSIKSACVIRMITLSPLFQFHTGSIKSHSAANDCDSVGEFQFHTGSIKSMSLGIPKPTHSHACFNSILVRLKVQATVNDFLRFAKFQFHTGSIKRLYENRDYIIRDPDGTRQVNFYFPHFLGSSAVNLQSCTFAGRSTATDRACVEAGFRQKQRFFQPLDFAFSVRSTAVLCLGACCQRPLSWGTGRFWGPHTPRTT